MQIIIGNQELEIKMPTKEQHALHFEIMTQWRERCAAMNKIIPFYDATNNASSFLAWLIDEGYIQSEGTQP